MSALNASAQEAGPPPAEPNLQSLPYTTSFEKIDGFEPGNLDGQRGWSVEQGSVEVAAGGQGTGNALRINPSRPSGQVSLRFDPADTEDSIVYSDFHVKPVAVLAALGANADEDAQFIDAEGSIAGFFKINRDGELFVLNGNGENGGEWLPTGASFITTINGQQVGEWVHLTLRQDFQAKVWDLYIDGKISLGNLGLWSDEAEFLNRFSLMGHSQYPLYFDDLTISAENTTFTDADRDGMPDEWEVPLGEFHHRDDDPDDDGLTNIEELVLGTDPMIADTDGDGQLDGAFLAGQATEKQTDQSSEKGESNEEQTDIGRIKEDPDIAAAIAKRRSGEAARRRNFTFPENPTEGDLISSQILLVPFARDGEATDADRKKLAAALEKYMRGGKREAIHPLEEFVGANPDSPYRFWVEAGMGYALWEESRFSRAISVYRNIWERKKGDDSGETGVLVSFVGARLARYLASAGGADELAAVLADSKTRNSPLINSQELAVAAATHGAMKRGDRGTYSCGIDALCELLGKRKDELIGVEVDLATSNGVSLRQLENFANTNGMEMRAAKRGSAPLRQLPLPAIAHLKSGHFVALLAKNDDRYYVSDATFRSHRWVSELAIDEESSGYFLVRDLADKVSFTDVEEVEAVQVKGSKIPASRSDESPCDKGCAGRGQPVVGYNLFSGVHTISDIPISVPAPLAAGGAIEFSIIHRGDDGVDGGGWWKRPNLGEGWFVGWGANVNIDSAADEALIVLPDGRREIWRDENASTGYWKHNSSSATFKTTGSGTFVRTSSDGSKITFSYHGASAWGNKFYVSQIVDSSGMKTIVEAEDVDPGSSEAFRPKRIKDELGNGIELSYVSNSLSSSNNVLKINKVTDLRNPSGTGAREASFTYSGDKLTKVTDVEGIWAEFDYAAKFEYIDSSGNLQISTSNIPYTVSEMRTDDPDATAHFKTKFTMIKDNGNNSEYRRGVIITDPEGFQERIEYRNYFPESHALAGVYYITDGAFKSASANSAERPLVAVAGDVMRFENLNMGTSLHWGKKAMHDTLPNPVSGANYDKAAQTHWLCERNPITGGALTSVVGIPSSYRSPLTYRVFYRYPGQAASASPEIEGSMRGPVTVARVVQNETGGVSTDAIHYDYYNNASWPAQYGEVAGEAE
ncbi:MAG: hypothetical protein KDN22_34205, partial [Verrucomicrobiae bacterium]|nr:hypothetical protein [Verrucomicrobiae bacterium]